MENEMMVIPKRTTAKEVTLSLTRAEMLMLHIETQLGVQIGMQTGILPQQFAQYMPDVQGQKVALSLNEKLSDAEHMMGWCEAKDCEHKK